MSEQVIGMLISLAPNADQKSFEDFLIEETKKEHVFEQRSETSFYFYKRLGADREYVGIARFDGSEFDRVTRAAHPFIVRAIKEILLDLHERQAEVSTVFSATTEPLETLKERWNKEFGQFTPVFTTASA
jgi:hypothetical protein